MTLPGPDGSFLASFAGPQAQEVHAEGGAVDVKVLRSPAARRVRTLKVRPP
jgi:hypothetical protein